MFGLGFWEIVVIAVVALLFIGPDRLPKFFRALGRATREFQRASKELRENLSIDEPPPRRPPQRPAVDLRAEGSEPRPTSRVLEMPRLPPDEWPKASAAKAESKPGEPFDEIPHPVREVPAGAPPSPASPPPVPPPATVPVPPPVPAPPAPPPIMTAAPAPASAPATTPTKEGKG